MPRWIALLNTVAAFLSVVFATIILARPNQFIPPTLRRQIDRFAAATYVVRAIPLGSAMVVAVWIAPTGIATAFLLRIACVAQVGGLVLGVVHRVWGMAGGVGSGVIFHAVGIAAAAGVVGWNRGLFRWSRLVRRGPS